MRTIPFVATDPELIARVSAVVGSCPGFDAGLVPVPTADDARAFLDVEMPDLAFLNVSDPAIDAFALLDAVAQDPWLHSAGVVGFCATGRATRELEKRRGINLVACVDHEDVETMLPPVLGVLMRNQRILFHRGLGAGLLQTVSGSFEIPNSLVECHAYANLVCNYLFNAGKIDARAKASLNVALVEMLLNAVEHGNCGITREEKADWLRSGRPMREFVAQRCQDAAIGRRRVLFEYALGPARSTFLIADQGDGFDWRAAVAPDAPLDLEAPNGRGILMTVRSTPSLRYNERGNEVTFEVEHPVEADARPALFESVAPTAFEAGDVVFREGEPGDDLYYIVKGSFEVQVRGRVVTTLTPDDLLLGEMAFLLHNRRTATVRATTAGTLLRLGKRDFIEAVKRRPHYGLFLARLLARRLERGNGDAATPG